MEKDLFKNKKENKVAEQVVDVNDVSRISAGTIIKGEIASPTDIRIDGTVDGKIFSRGKIVVGESAFIRGSVLCSVMDFWGKMEGDIYVKDTLSLKSTSSVEGNINVRKFQVEMGSQINGSCHMISEAEFDKAFDSLKAPEKPAPKASADADRQKKAQAAD